MTNLQAIDLLKGLEQSLDDYCELNDEGKTAFGMAITALELFGNSEQFPSAQPEQHLDEWCVDCKEYDKEKHSCPRWNRVIRQTLLDAQPERKTGRWIWQKRFYTFDGEKREILVKVCSYCGKPPIAGVESPYCPHCGEKKGR